MSVTVFYEGIVRRDRRPAMMRTAIAAAERFGWGYESSELEIDITIPDCELLVLRPYDEPGSYSLYAGAR